ncbi:MAG: hypothetical protein ACREX3_00735 [Gammaproteobacteria bacterium]
MAGAESVGYHPQIALAGRRTQRHADVDDLERDLGFRSSTPIEKGIARLVRWYKDEWLPSPHDPAERARNSEAAGRGGTASVVVGSSHEAAITSHQRVLGC